MRHITGSRLRVLLPVAVLALLLFPAVVTAHAELETSTPKDGATVEGTPPEVSGTYSEAMDPGGSSLKLLDAGGTQVAAGGVDPADDKRMAITDLPELAPGTYTVKSTTKSAADGDLDRKEWTFTVEVAASPRPAPSATPTPTPEPTPNCTDDCTGASPAGPTAAPTATPAPSPSAGGGTTGTGSDVLLPIIAAVVIVAVIAGYLFTRRDRTPTQP